MYAEVARAVLHEARGASSEGASIPPRPIRFDVYETFLRGQVHCSRWSFEDLQKGVAHLQHTTELEPTYAAAYAMLFSCYGAMAHLGYAAPRALIEKRRVMLAKVAEFPEQLGDLPAEFAFYEEWNWPKAEAAFRSALAATPDNPRAHQIFAWYLAAMGRFNDAIAQADAARKLSPVDPAAQLASGSVLWFAGQYDRGVEECRQAVSLQPDYAVAHLYLGWALLLQGNKAGALVELRRATKLDPDNTYASAMLAHALALSGDRREATPVLDTLEALSRRRYVSPFQLAIAYAGLGDRARAIEWLENAYSEHVSFLVWLNVDQRFDSLRSDPRFISLLARMKFPPRPAATAQAR